MAFTQRTPDRITRLVVTLTLDVDHDESYKKYGLSYRLEKVDAEGKRIRDAADEGDGETHLIGAEVNQARGILNRLYNTAVQGLGTRPLPPGPGA